MRHFNKKIIALAALSAFTGFAQAASSVTVYGRFDVGYARLPSAVYDDKTGAFTQSHSFNQVSNGDVRLGIKGSEDLGNGMAATFQLEGRFDGDTGAKSVGRTFFDRESTVGLKFGASHVRFGRSISAFEQGVSFVDVGRRYSAYSVYNENYGVATRHSNAMFYNYSKNGFSAGADIATKGGFDDGVNRDGTSRINEAALNSKIAWGAFANYKAGNLELGLAYQDDGVQTAKRIRSELGIGVSYKFAPVTVGVSYAQGKDDVATSESKVRNYGAFISAKITPMDTVNVIYRTEQLKTKNALGQQTLDDKINRIALGYIHNISKRTSVYADVGRIKRTINVTTSKADVKSTGYDFGISHYF
jgi:predicted porin